MTELNIEHRAVENNPAVQVGEHVRMRVSQEKSDPAWDAFLARTPDGHHVQTSLWAQVKAVLGWKALRLVAWQDDQIVGGAQILLRSWPLAGSLGYISKGPLFAPADPELSNKSVAALQRLVKKHRIQHLTIQPPGSGIQAASTLTAAGFRPSSAEVAPKATLLLDLSKDQETLMAEMSARTRYNIRLSSRKGVVVRAGTEQDLDIYYKILTETGQRQKFAPYPRQYFSEMWRILQPHGYLKLFMAEFEGEVVSAQLSVPFGDTVINKLSVWSGRHGKVRPNEALQWAVICWAQDHGYRYYDFEGIKPAAAAAVLRQEPPPESVKNSVTSFKLGFGGEARLFSGAYDYVTNPFYRWAYCEIFPRIRHQRRVKRLLKRLRTQ